MFDLILRVDSISVGGFMYDSFEHRRIVGYTKLDRIRFFLVCFPIWLGLLAIGLFVPIQKNGSTNKR